MSKKLTALLCAFLMTVSFGLAACKSDTPPGSDPDTITVSFDLQGGTGTAADKSVKVGDAYGTLPSVTKYGYNQDGWWTEAAGGTKITAATAVVAAPDNKRILYARWNAKTNIPVDFELDGGVWTDSDFASYKVTFGEKYAGLPEAADVTKTNHTFIGWQNAAGGDVDGDTVVTVDGYHTLTAQWAGSSVLVTFNAGAGTGLSYATETYTFGGTYDSLPTVTAPYGYIFTGWFTNSVGGTQVIAGTTTVTAAANLYAQYAAVNNIEVTLDANGGDWDTEELPVKITVTFDAPYAALAGKEDDLISPDPGVLFFGGWWTAAECECDPGPCACVRVTASEPNVADAGAHTLYARWIESPLEVTFESNMEGVSVGSMTFSIGTDYDNLPQPTKTGYTFLGWFIDDETFAVEIQDGDEVVDVNGDGTLILYGKWEEKLTTVTLDANKGSGSTTPTPGTATVYAQEGFEMPSASAPTRTGYIFDGYFANANGTGTKYYDASMLSVTDWDSGAASATLYAKWIAQTATVTLDANGGTGGTTGPLHITATFDEAMPAFAAPSFSGWTFGGYFDNNDGSGTQYYTAAMASVADWTSTASSVTLYAKWTTTVAFNANSAGISQPSAMPVNMSVTYNGSKPALSGSAPVREHYAFTGFFTAASGGSKVYNDDMTRNGNTWNITATTLYAQWTRDANYIDFTQAGDENQISGNWCDTGSMSLVYNSTDKQIDVTLTGPGIVTPYINFTGLPTGSYALTFEVSMTFPGAMNGSVFFEVAQTPPDFRVTTNYYVLPVANAWPAGTQKIPAITTADSPGSGYLFLHTNSVTNTTGIVLSIHSITISDKVVYDFAQAGDREYIHFGGSVDEGGAGWITSDDILTYDAGEQAMKFTNAANRDLWYLNFVCAGSPMSLRVGNYVTFEVDIDFNGSDNMTGPVYFSMCGKDPGGETAFLGSYFNRGSNFKDSVMISPVNGKWPGTQRISAEITTNVRNVYLMVDFGQANKVNATVYLRKIEVSAAPVPIVFTSRNMGEKLIANFNSGDGSGRGWSNGVGDDIMVYGFDEVRNAVTETAPAGQNPGMFFCNIKNLPQGGGVMAGWTCNIDLEVVLAPGKTFSGNCLVNAKAWPDVWYNDVWFGGGGNSDRNTLTFTLNNDGLIYLEFHPEQASSSDLEGMTLYIHSVTLTPPSA